MPAQQDPYKWKQAPGDSEACYLFSGDGEIENTGNIML